MAQLTREAFGPWQTEWKAHKGLAVDAIRERMSARLVVTALRTTVARRAPTGVAIYSD